MEFATEAYNYNTTDDADPKNLVLLATTQGTAVRQDGKGQKRLYHHAVSKSGKVQDHWLEAERSRHSVGGPQKESKEEREDAMARGKALSSVIGIKSMGTRFNILMTIQVPLKQKPKIRYRGGFRSFGVSLKSAECLLAQDAECFLAPSCAPSANALQVRSRSCRRRAAPEEKSWGTANAARVSRGSRAGTFAGLGVKSPARHPSEHVTVTVVIYNTVAGGVPSGEDVRAAVEDMEALYASCTVTGRLSQGEFDFMKKPLALDDMSAIATKTHSQPAQAEPSNAHREIQNFNVFPANEAA